MIVMVIVMVQVTVTGILMVRLIANMARAGGNEDDIRCDGML